MRKTILAALAALGFAAAANAAGWEGQDPMAGVKACPGSASYEYVGGTLFDFDKSIPSALEMDSLGRGYDKAVKQFNASNYIWVYVKGTTDSVGTDEYNDKLGMRRAEAVKKALVEHGVQDAMVHMKSFGKRWPKYDNKTEEGRHMNRAAHVSIVSMDQEKADWCYSQHPESVPKAPWWMLP